MGSSTGSEKDRFLTQCESTWEEMRYWEWKWGKRDGNAKLHVRPWATTPPLLSFLPFHFIHVMIHSQSMSKSCSLGQSLLSSFWVSQFSKDTRFPFGLYVKCSQPCSWLVSSCQHAPRHHSFSTFLYSARLCKCNNASVCDSGSVGGGMKIKWNKRRKKTRCKQEADRESWHVFQ